VANFVCSSSDDVLHQRTCLFRAFGDVWSSREYCHQKINCEQRQGSDSEHLGEPDPLHNHRVQPKHQQKCAQYS
jgi:hypothetical protein